MFFFVLGLTWPYYFGPGPLGFIIYFSRLLVAANPRGWDEGF